MAIAFELLGPTDKPALLALTHPELLAAGRSALEALGYKVHAAAGHDDFISRFSQIQYQIVLLEELFNASAAAENRTLAHLQSLPMNLRRHAVVILLGESFQTLQPMQAFRQSVQAVVGAGDLPSLSQIIQKSVADNDLFLRLYREVQSQLAQGKL